MERAAGKAAHLLSLIHIYRNAHVKGYQDGKYVDVGMKNNVAHNHPDFIRAAERWYKAVCGEIQDYLAPVSYTHLEHEIIVDNYIHDNAGAGIGMMYRENQPSFNGLIQNNRIVNNGQYAIYLENADWFEINGNVMEGNGTRLAEGTDGDVVHQAANVTNIIQRDGAQYQENYENYLDLVPEAVIESAPANRFSVGEERCV